MTLDDFLPTLLLSLISKVDIEFNFLESKLAAFSDKVSVCKGVSDLKARRLTYCEDPARS